MTSCALTCPDHIMPTPEKPSWPRRSEVLHSHLKSVNDNGHAAILEKASNVVKDNDSISFDKESSNAMDELFCGSTFDEYVDAVEASFCESLDTEKIGTVGQKSPSMNVLHSNPPNIKEGLMDYSTENMHDNSFSLILEESSSDEMTNIDSDNSCIQEMNKDDYLESFDHCNVKMDPLSKNGESLCELNTCCQVSENTITPPMTVFKNKFSSISQRRSLNSDNLQVVVPCVKSPNLKLTNTYKEICVHEASKNALRSQPNRITAIEKMYSPTTAAVKNIKLDNNAEITSFPVASQSEKTMNTIVGTNDAYKTAAPVTELDMTNPIKMTDTMNTLVGTNDAYETAAPVTELHQRTEHAKVSEIMNTLVGTNDAYETAAPVAELHNMREHDRKSETMNTHVGIYDISGTAATVAELDDMMEQERISEIINTLVGTNDTSGTAATVAELDNVMEHNRMSETMNTLVGTNDTSGTAATVAELHMTERDRMLETSFVPCEESELNDLDLEFVPFGIPSLGECIMSQERATISRYETQLSFRDSHEQKCDISKKMEQSSTRLSFDHEQEKSLLLTARMNQKLQDSESVEDQKSENVGCIKVDHLFAKCREERNGKESLCCNDILSREYCLIDHNLTFFANECKISLQFDVNEKLFACPFCSVSSLNTETIGQHILDHVSDKELKCLLGCKDVFLSMKEVVDHLTSHKDNEVYRCGACRNTFPTVALIKSHVAMLHEQGQFKKQTHEHEIDRRFMCANCGLYFAQANSLILHNLTKCSSQSHSCSLCKLCFQSASELKKHAASHCNQRPYHCKLCSYASDNRCDLHFHLNQHWNNDQPYTCPECSAVCPNKSSYKAHVLELHCSGNLRCVCCKRSDFTHGHQLIAHMRAHEAHGWTENKVPGLRLMSSLQVMAAVRQERDKGYEESKITVTDCGGVRLQFTPANFLTGEEQDFVSFEMNIA